MDWVELGDRKIAIAYNRADEQAGDGPDREWPRHASFYPADRGLARLALARAGFVLDALEQDLHECRPFTGSVLVCYSCRDRTIRTFGTSSASPRLASNRRSVAPKLSPSKNGGSDNNALAETGIDQFDAALSALRAGVERLHAETARHEAVLIEEKGASVAVH